MAATGISFRWLDILEKEFDKAFVDLDILIGTYILSDPELFKILRFKKLLGNIIIYFTC